MNIRAIVSAVLVAAAVSGCASYTMTDRGTDNAVNQMIGNDPTMHLGYDLDQAMWFVVSSEGGWHITQVSDTPNLQSKRDDQDVFYYNFLKKQLHLWDSDDNLMGVLQFSCPGSATPAVGTACASQFAVRVGHDAQGDLYAFNIRKIGEMVSAIGVARIHALADESRTRKYNLDYQHATESSGNAKRFLALYRGFDPLNRRPRVIAALHTLELQDDARAMAKSEREWREHPHSAPQYRTSSPVQAQDSNGDRSTSHIEYRDNIGNRTSTMFDSNGAPNTIVRVYQ